MKKKEKKMNMNIKLNENIKVMKIRLIIKNLEKNYQ